MSQTEQQLIDSLRNLVVGQPFEPDLAAIHRRGRRLRRRARLARGAVGAGVVAVAAAVAVSVIGLQTGAERQPAAASPVRSAASPHAASAHPVSPAATATATSAPGGQLMTLADYIARAVKPAGDATLVLGTQTYPGEAVIPRADLYADNGTYYFAHTKSGLPAQVAGHHAQDAGGLYAREAAAAVLAGKGGNIATARQQMADAGMTPGEKPLVSQQDLNTADSTGVIRTDNWIWSNSMDALEAGAGHPLVRAGVLRLLATMPGISIAHVTSGGRQALVLTAGAPVQTPGYQEALTIDARTGVPTKFVGGDLGSTPTVIVTYQVSRVTLSDVAAGKF